MTSRKHFQRAADYIKTHLVLAEHSEEACEAAYRVVVDLFRSDNPRFDTERFRLACGLLVGGGSVSRGWEVQGNYGYGHGYERVTTEVKRSEALARLKEYRDNEPGVPFRLRRERSGGPGEA